MTARARGRKSPRPRSRRSPPKASGRLTRRRGPSTWCGDWKPARAPCGLVACPRACSRRATAAFVPAHSDTHRMPVEGRMTVTRTRDGGASFETFGEGLPSHDAYHLVYRYGLAVSEDGNTLAMGSTTGGLWTSEDGGATWQ